LVLYWVFFRGGGFPNLSHNVHNTQVKLMEEAASKAAGGGTPRTIGEFIAAAVEPPLPQAVTNAVRSTPLAIRRPQ
jgi:hypothetical protein